ncbi:sporulation protein Cse60 [Bacillus sp. OK048]|uniref:sporulation protein Cse60 n=1 Tax=Bacillus sp. OK048 TaxID=1882761 RepID=UPI0008864361|nr:sporulation protein Cse60 [Bacillus sp. OK048]SDN56713.1 Protein of unknown function [Bacillus sp. OK048]
MNRVKIFDYENVEKLEDAVNGFLETMECDSSFKLIDIKFNSYAYGEDRTDYHSAMVIYKI